MLTAEQAARHHNLPAQTTSLIGREWEIEAVLRRLLSPEVRLLTLTGPGGVGKTRLAIAVAESFFEGRDHFAHGLFLVSLASLRDAALVMPMVARTLGLPEVPGEPPLETLQRYLRLKEILLVLDNFEPVLEAATEVALLLETCPDLKVLVASQALLRVRGEHQWEVSPLKVPDAGGNADVERLAQYPAVQLFLARAKAMKDDFVLREENAPATAEICRRLEGLPLAIELAAARIRHLPPEAMLARMEKRLGLLTAGARDLPERQRTMRQAIAWSYDLLNEAEQTLFRRLSVFVGGCTLAAAGAVCDAKGDLALDPLEGIARLVDQSLLREVAEGSEPRYLMLETVREYGQECLAATGEEEETRKQHARFCLCLVQEAYPELVGPRQKAWLERLTREHDNLRAALGRAIDSGDSEVALGIAGGLWRFWGMLGHLAEGRRWAERALAASDPTPSSARGLAFLAAASSCLRQGDLANSIGYSRLSRVSYEAVRDRQGLAYAFLLNGTAETFRRDFAGARTPLEESLTIFRQIEDETGVGGVLYMLGMALTLEGGYELARPLLEESLALFRRSGNPWDTAFVLGLLGLIASFQREPALARTRYEESIRLYWALGDKHIVGWTVIPILAWGMAVEGQAERAATLIGTAEAFHQTIDDPSAGIHPVVQLFHEQAVPLVRERLGEELFNREVAKGKSMTLEEAVAYALGTEEGAPATPVPAKGPPVGKAQPILGPREEEVAVLIARGYANRQIADQLVISPRTVETHVANILRKLDLDSRSQLAVWAVEQGLLNQQTK